MPYFVIVAGIVNISLFFFILNVIDALGNYQLISIFILEFFHCKPYFHYSYNFALDQYNFYFGNFLQNRSRIN
jgi:hypothetical protein